MQRQQNRCFHFQIADAVQISTDFPQDLASGDKCLLDIRVYDQVQIPLTVTGVLILQTVPLLRQGKEGLGEHGDLCGVDGNLALAGTEYEALDTDNIADIPLLKFLEFLLANVVHADIDLNTVGVVPYIDEVGTSHVTPAHDTAGNRDGLSLQRVQLCLKRFFVVTGLCLELRFGCLIFGFDGSSLCGHIILGNGERVVALCLSLPQLFQTDLPQGIAVLLLFRNRRIGLICHWIHFLYSYLLISRISNCSSPTGASIMKLSPTFFFIAPAPMGDSSEILCSAKFASLLLTIWRVSILPLL